MRVVLIVAALASGLLASGCGHGGEAPAAGAPAPLAGAPHRAGEEAAMGMILFSPDFEANGIIPALHTCDDADVSPELRWSGAPEGTRSFALIVDDPDAPDPEAPKTIWVHWVLHDLPPGTSGLARGIEELPAGTREGKNDWGKTGYRGPCPPIGQHRYFFRLHALDTVLGDLGAPTRTELTRAMEGHVLSVAELMGRYQRGK